MLSIIDSAQGEGTQPTYLGNVTQLHDHVKVGFRGSSEFVVKNCKTLSPKSTWTCVLGIRKLGLNFKKSKINKWRDIMKKHIKGRMHKSLIECILLVTCPS